MMMTAAWLGRGLVRGGWVAAVLVGGLHSACTKEEPEPAELATGDQVIVEEVVKGDELIVDEKGRSARVRLLGVHAFDEVIEDEAVARAAKSSVERLGGLVVGKTITVQLTDKTQDRYGRYLAYAIIDGKDLARTLIEEGVSMVYTEYAFDRMADYLGAERAAREGKRGLWRDPAVTKMAHGLRRQWREARGGHGPEDPLLAEPAEVAPAEEPEGEGASVEPVDVPEDAGEP